MQSSCPNTTASSSATRLSSVATTVTDAPLRLDQYQQQACITDRRPENFTFPLLGLFGEAGSLLSEVKKQQRDTASYIGYADNVREELGDVLWYFTAVASRAKLSIANIAQAVLQDDIHLNDEAASLLSFADLQEHSVSPHLEPTSAFETTLLHLADSIGSIVRDHQAGTLNDNQPAVSTHLITILRILIHAANEAGVTLDHAARDNLEKIFDRWPQKREYPKPFDRGFPDHEQLPRHVTIDIFECPAKIQGKSYVIQRCNGINIGDRLTDNRMTPDDYRFHDVFHYAYAAVLGWSPVTRALFRVKRKSDDRIDEAEDGARAILIEEGLATWIFAHAKRLRFFDGICPGDLNFGLLKDIRSFVSGYEAERCPLWLWEEAILQGYAAFRFLKEHRCGKVHVHMIQHKLTVERLPT